MFAAIFNLRAEPIDVQRLGAAGHCSVETFGGARRAAFVHSNAGPYGVQGEPCVAASLGDRYWIVGRVRLNARRDLEARLALGVGEDAKAASDAALCLHAYAAWGEQFVEFLFGDYAFVLWDDARQRLLGVRDQLGTRALFHARIGDAWFVGDTLDWMIRRPSISQELDDYWIADLLTLGFCREFERTVYRAVQRLAPAHVLKLDEAGPHIRRYWRLEIVEPVYFRDRATYAERFRDLLSQSIADRMPPGRLGISMSGGLDSTTLAACAVGVASPSRVVGDSVYSEEFSHLKEDYFASLAARHLGIELRLRRWDMPDHDSDWRSHGLRPAEPSVTMFDARYRRQMIGEQACEASVWFDGEGPDNALIFERDAYLSWLVGRRAWGRLGGALLEYVRVKGLGGWRQSVRRHALPRPEADPVRVLPRWLNRDFADRLHLEERIRALGEGGDTSHPWHPNAVASFTSPIWQSHFADFDFDEALGPVVWRHPYLDTRVLDYLLSVPPIPWAWKKQLVREAMRGRMPDELLKREKTSMPQEDIGAVLSRLRCMPEFMANGQLGKYVDVSQISTHSVPEFMPWPALSVFALDHWLTLDFK